MTNYNERLDEVLNDFGWTCIADGGDGYGLQNEDVSEAKQAITSLIKELVAKAEPINEQGEIDIDVPAYNDGYYSGANNALEKFEQNLLKELEEV